MFKIIAIISLQSATGGLFPAIWDYDNGTDGKVLVYETMEQCAAALTNDAIAEWAITIAKANVTIGRTVTGYAVRCVEAKLSDW